LAPFTFAAGGPRARTLSWQIVPTALGQMLGDQDPQKAKRVMEAMLKMKKIESAGLKSAYEGRA
jgi:hypothetical protein